MLRIVMMGTPDFAVPSLDALVHAGHSVVAVFCQPDRPKGRGHKMQACAMKVEAEKLGIPVFQPARIRLEEGVSALRSLAPDLCVTAAYGQLLTQEILDIPRLGTINVHASLLPRHRGAAPIQWSILMGDEETGVTTMMTDIGMDTGDMLLSAKTPITPTDDAASLTDRLSRMGAELLIETLSELEKGTLVRTPQNPDLATTESKIRKEMGFISFEESSDAIDRRIRAMSPWPCAYTLIDGETMKIYSVKEAGHSGSRPGTILTADPHQGLVVACDNCDLEILELQMPGSKRMSARDYLRGHSITTGIHLGREEV